MFSFLTSSMNGSNGSNGSLSSGSGILVAAIHGVVKTFYGKEIAMHTFPWSC